MRVIAKLHHPEDEDVHGVVIADPEGIGAPQPFMGWPERLRLLEILEPPAA